MAIDRFHDAHDIRDSVESLQALHGVGRPYIYWLCMLTAAAFLIALPLVKVDTSVGAPGQIRPAIERLSVYPAAGGFIKTLAVYDNKPVHKGDVLLTIDSTSVDAQISQYRQQSEENTNELEDLRLLLAKVTPLASRPFGKDTQRYPELETKAYTTDLESALRTGKYIQQYAVFLSNLQRLDLQESKAEHDYLRSQSLHTKHLISDSDFDQQRFTRDSAIRDVDVQIQQTLGTWQADKVDHEQTQLNLESQVAQLQQQKDLYTVRAPTDGTALGFDGLHVGLFLPLGQLLGTISPGGGMQADVYVSPTDIGFVRQGQPVKIQVDAFPYTEWGTLKGTVHSVSQDFVQVGQQIAFKAVIDLASTHLESSNGAKVALRRGMTINARFIVNRQSLFHLLYSNLSDSFDPAAKTSG